MASEILEIKKGGEPGEGGLLYAFIYFITKSNSCQ